MSTTPTLTAKERNREKKVTKEESRKLFSQCKRNGVCLFGSLPASLPVLVAGWWTADDIRCCLPQTRISDKPQYSEAAFFLSFLLTVSWQSEQHRTTWVISQQSVIQSCIYTEQGQLWGWRKNYRSVSFGSSVFSKDIFFSRSSVH